MANISMKRRVNPKYPLLVTYKRKGEVKKMIVPDQHAFKTDFLREHGCSIMAEYVALQWLGCKQYKPYGLMKLHKQKTKAEVKTKVTVKGVAQLLGELVPMSFILYRNQPTLKRIKSQLDAGNIVLLEEGDPIHTVVLLRAEGKYWRLTNGKCQAVDIEKEAKRATNNPKYAGMVVVGDLGFNG